MSPSTGPLPPGSVIGLLGGGQLGRMFAKAATRLGYRVHVLSPEEDPPAAAASWAFTRADYRDAAALRELSDSVTAVTYEFENVPRESVELLEERGHIVAPGSNVLRIAQDRSEEKRWLDRAGFPVAAWRFAESEADLERGAREIGGPAVAKTCRDGYDGRGQARVGSPADAGKVWERFGGRPLVLEELVDFAHECSVVVSRDRGGRVIAFPLLRNLHRNHILDLTVYPCGLDLEIALNAESLARDLAESIGLVGVLCVELFVTSSGRLLVNELAPRPHNSGHLTLEAFSISQFEFQARALAGLPLTTPVPRAPAAAMVNLFGDLWRSGEPDWAAVMARPDVHFHLYGKLEPRPGRKMGHLTLLSSTPEQAARGAVAAREVLAHRAAMPAAFDAASAW